MTELRAVTHAQKQLVLIVSQGFEGQLYLRIRTFPSCQLDADDKDLKNGETSR